MPPSNQNLIELTNQSSLKPISASDLSPSVSFELDEWQSILNMIPLPAMIFRLADESIVFTNHHFNQLLELASELPTCLRSLKSYIDPSAHQNLMNQFNQQNCLRNYEIQLKKTNQTSFNTSISLQKLVLSGELMVLCTVYDLTNHQETETALRQSEARFRTLAETTNAIIFIRQGNQFCYVNPAAQLITGYKREELLAYPDIHQLIKERGRVRSLSPLFFPKLFPQYEEVKILKKNGDECWLDCSVAVIDFDGKPAVLGTAIDITKRKQAEEKVRNALTKEKELNELKSHFISMVSHEFRSPLNIIAFSASSLQRSYYQWDDEKKLKYLARINTSVDQISGLLDEVLLIGRAEAGQLNCSPKEIDVSQLCREIVIDMELSDGNQHPIIFINHTEHSIAYLDEKILQPILTNLLSNALKYSPRLSPVQLELQINEREVVFQIIDKGIGISLEDRKRLCELFHRGNNVGSIPGHGLGLAIVNRFVAAHHGQFTVISELGIGTICTITLPLLCEALI